MSKQTTKAQLLSDIKTTRQQLEKSLAILSTDEMLIGGVVGSWSVKDVLAHLAAWEGLFLGWYQAGLRNEIPEPSPVGMSHTAMDELNQQIFEAHQHDSLDKVQAEFQNSYRLMMQVIESIPEKDLFTHKRFAWTGRWTLADYVAGNTCNHYRWARTKIRQWQLVRNKPDDLQEKQETG